MKKSRLLWAVMFWDGSPDGRPHLCFGGWHPEMHERYQMEPSRLVAFRTRKAARTFADANTARWKQRSDFVNKWRMRVVRVRETVTVI